MTEHDPDAETQPLCLHNRVQIEPNEPLHVFCLDCLGSIDVREWAARHRDYVRTLAGADFFMDERQGDLFGNQRS